MARPAAIAVAVTAAAVLLAVGIYVRRRERALFQTKAKLHSNGQTHSVPV
jgi:hypothetical protein